MHDNFIETEEYQPYNKVYTHASGHHIFLGDITAANDHEFLAREQIRTVVSASAQMDHLQYDKTVTHHVYNLLDATTQSMSQYFSGFFQLMEGELRKNSVLVHCFAGVSRSATLVLSYTMRKNEWGFREAIGEMRKYRAKVLPNLGFERQLKAYEKQLKSQQVLQQIQPPPALAPRKYISKTSESKKHHQIKNNSTNLPEIMALGKTLNRNQHPSISISSSLREQHPSSQMENRAKKVQMMFNEGAEREFPPMNFSQQIMENNLYNPLERRPMKKSFRKRSVSNNRSTKKQGGILQELERDMKSSRISVIPQKFILRDIKISTEKQIRGY